MRKVISFVLMFLVSLVTITAIYNFFKNKEYEKTSTAEVINVDFPGASKDNPNKLSGSIPSQQWDFESKETYYFSGNSRQLFTNYKFIGSEQYYISIKNNGNNTIEMIVMTGIKRRLQIFTIPPNYSESFVISEIGKEKAIYLCFQHSKGNSNISFLGYIRKNSNINRDI